MKVNIAERMVRGSKRWVVDWTPPGKPRQRHFFNSRSAAEACGETVRLESTGAQTFWVNLRAAQRIEILALIEEMATAGKTLREVWAHYQATPRLSAKTLGQLATEVLTAKKAANRRDSYIKNLKRWLARFNAGREDENICRIGSAEIEAWLARDAWGMQSKATALSRVTTMFSHAVRRGYISQNPCMQMDRITIDRSPPRILSVSESARALTYTRRKLPKLLPWLVLGLFAGIRPQEADQLTWDVIDLDRKTVRIDGAVSKVRTRRIVHLRPTAVAWLKLAKATGGELPISPVTRRKQQRSLRDRMRFRKWPADVLRHTAASNLLATIQDAGKVANELGNSPVILLTHYKELVYKEQAKAFWNLLPTRRMLTYPPKTETENRPKRN